MLTGNGKVRETLCQCRLVVRRLLEGLCPILGDVLSGHKCLCEKEKESVQDATGHTNLTIQVTLTPGLL